MKVNPSLFGGTIARSGILSASVLLLMVTLNSRQCSAQSAGTLDTSFAPVLGNSDGILALAVQPDGHILAGGSVNPGLGLQHGMLRRFLPDGSEENSSTFNPGTGFTGFLSVVGDLLIQPDGKILVGGRFTAVDGQPRNGIARLNADGSLESITSFDPGEGVDDTVSGIALQPDGKILIGGTFTRVNGEPRNRLARLYPDGSLEPLSSFDPGNNAPNETACVSVLEDGKIIVGGRSSVVRLTPNGSLDTVLQPNSIVAQCIVTRPDGTTLIGGTSTASGVPQPTFWGVRRLGASPAYHMPLNSVDHTVYSLGLQADGKIIAGGYWENNLPIGVKRLKANGTVETSAEFAAALSGSPVQVNAVALASDGKVILGGAFVTVNGQSRRHIARLFNDPATQTLTIANGGASVQWMRGGSAPEVSLVTFERSTDAGQSWTLLGQGTRIAGGWQITGFILPPDAAVRARGRTGDGRSSGIVEQLINVPEIAVESPSGTNLNDDRATVDYGPTPATGLTKTFTIRNPGTVPLQNLAVSLAPGGNAGDFSVTQPASATLAPGATATFTVTFTPGGAGTRTASIQVASNDPDENPFDIAVTGRLATASEAWRITHFGSPDNTGPGADLNDPDNDGLVNLLEFAVGGNPHDFSPPIGTLVKNGATLEFTYTRPTAAVAELNYQFQASTTLSGVWSSTGVTSTILSDDGTTQVVKATAPAGSLGKRYVRLRVTRQ